MKSSLSWSQKSPCLPLDTFTVPTRSCTGLIARDSSHVVSTTLINRQPTEGGCPPGARQRRGRRLYFRVSVIQAKIPAHEPEVLPPTDTVYCVQYMQYTDDICVETRFLFHTDVVDAAGASGPADCSQAAASVSRGSTPLGRRARSSQRSNIAIVYGETTANVFYD